MMSMVQGWMWSGDDILDKYQGVNLRGDLNVLLLSFHFREWVKWL